MFSLLLVYGQGGQGSAHVTMVSSAAREPVSRVSFNRRANPLSAVVESSWLGRHPALKAGGTLFIGFPLFLVLIGILLYLNTRKSCKNWLKPSR